MGWSVTVPLQTAPPVMTWNSAPTVCGNGVSSNIDLSVNVLVPSVQTPAVLTGRPKGRPLAQAGGAPRTPTAIVAARAAPSTAALNRGCIAHLLAQISEPRSPSLPADSARGSERAILPSMQFR